MEGYRCLRPGTHPGNAMRLSQIRSGKGTGDYRISFGMAFPAGCARKKGIRDGCQQSLLTARPQNCGWHSGVGRAVRAFETSTKEARGKSVASRLSRASQRTKMKRILLSWSSGKDSAWTLKVLRQRSDYEIAGLLTTFNQAADRVAMHGVRRSLVEQQAAAAGLPLWSVPLSWPCSNEQYELLMSETCAKAVAEGIEGVAFGDLFLEDVRVYRIRQMSGTGLEPLFPLWGIPTDILARQMITSGLKAILTCIDTRKLDRALAGRRFDEEFLSTLPTGIDPCGENGEFHSFVYAGPMFSSEISFTLGEKVVRDHFVFTDLIP